jgi:hypothetical protein
MVLGAMMLANARAQGIPYAAAVMLALRIAYAGCLAAALLGGPS